MNRFGKGRLMPDRRLVTRFIPPRWLPLPLVAAALAVLHPANTLAQSWPDRRIVIVSPYSAGGITDMLARLFAESFSKSLGQPVIVENRVGAGGHIGGMHVANAVPDGYTLLMAAGAMIVASPNTQPGIVKYDTTRDLEPIGIAAELPVLMITNPEVPARDFRELVAHAKSNAGKLTCASTGVGTAGHLACIQLEKVVGGNLPHLAYKGAPEANTDLIANRVQIYFGVMPTQIGFIRQGRLRAIGVASDERLPTAPDIPTLREQGFAVTLPAWNALFAPAGTPRPVLERLRAEHQKTLADPAIREQIQSSQSVIRKDSAADDLRRLITQDFAVFRKLAVEAGLRKD